MFFWLSSSVPLHFIPTLDKTGSAPTSFPSPEGKMIYPGNEVVSGLKYITV